jgi:hypothetical protein
MSASFLNPNWKKKGALIFDIEPKVDMHLDQDGAGTQNTWDIEG